MILTRTGAGYRELTRPTHGNIPLRMVRRRRVVHGLVVPIQRTATTSGYREITVMTRGNIPLVQRRVKPAPEARPVNVPQSVLDQYVLGDYGIGQLVTGAGRQAMALSVPKRRKKHWWERAITLPKPVRGFLQKGGGFLPAAIVAAPIVAPVVGRLGLRAGKALLPLVRPPAAPAQSITINPPGGVPVTVPVMPSAPVMTASDMVEQPGVQSPGGPAPGMTAQVGPESEVEVETAGKAKAPGLNPLLIVGGLLAVGMFMRHR